MPDLLNLSVCKISQLYKIDKFFNFSHPGYQRGTLWRAWRACLHRPFGHQ